MREALTFNDVLIVPKFSTISSRKDVDIGFDGEMFHYVRLPVITANMDTITGSDMAKTMLICGGQACLHRFCTIEENVKMFRDSVVTIDGHSWAPMVSIGLGSKEIERAEALKEAGANSITVDIAHGAQQATVDQVKELRKKFGSYLHIVVGNFASSKSVADFLERYHYVDAIKVGIGPGSMCSTRVQTGVGMPQFTAIQDIAGCLQSDSDWEDIHVIADGGLKAPGDIAKALGAGASMVMVGGMVAGTDETPGEKVLMANGSWAKKYRGSASKESYEAQGKVGSHRTTEGESTYVNYKGPVSNILQDIEGGLRSSFTYVGARNLQEFHEKVEFVRITNAGYIEGTPNGKK